MNGLAEEGITDDLLFGHSEIMQQLRRQVDNIAESGLPVLIEGESGTGKEVLARAIHARSVRHTRAFVKVSCAGPTPLPPLDRLLCGGECAGPQRECASEVRESTPAGTILFDEVGDLDGIAQPSLIAMLQDPRLATVGAGGVQVLCTTRTPLRPRLEAGLFRDDLYYRINVVNLRMPPLRDRRTDIPVLALHFLKLYAEAYQRDPGPFTQRILDAFVSADWPGNIRELENAVKRYIILGGSESVIADLQKPVQSTWIAGASSERSLKELRRNAVRACEYNVILTSLNRNQWNRRKTARELEISYRSLLYIMEQLGLPKKRRLTTAPPQSTSQTDQE